MNENKVDHMCQILDDMFQLLIPQRESFYQMGEEYVYNKNHMFEILIGEDQLTVSRARSAIAIRRAHDTEREKLQGLIPVIEDWHSRMTLLRVCIVHYMYTATQQVKNTTIKYKSVNHACTCTVYDY